MGYSSLDGLAPLALAVLRAQRGAESPLDRRVGLVASADQRSRRVLDWPLVGGWVLDMRFYECDRGIPVFAISVR